MEGLTQDDLGVLDPANNAGYGPKPIPVERDGEIAAVLERARDPAEFSGVAGSLHRAHVPVLLGFAERMASLAVRERDPERIRLGLVAVALAARIGDRREAALVLSLLDRACVLLGLDPDAEFARVADGLPAEAAEALASFVRRPPEDRAIEAMGYVEGDDEGGFRFRRTW